MVDSGSVFVVDAVDSGSQRQETERRRRTFRAGVVRRDEVVWVPTTAAQSGIRAGEERFRDRTGSYCAVPAVQTTEGSQRRTTPSGSLHRKPRVPYVGQ